MVLNEHAVLQHGEGTGPHLAIGELLGRVENDVVGLPLAGLAAGVDQRGVVAVERAALAVRIGLVVITIEHLDFIAAHQIDAAVAAALALALRGRRVPPIRRATGSRRIPPWRKSRLGRGFHRAILDFPFWFGAAFAAEFGQVLAIKEHDGIRRRTARPAGIDHRRLWLLPLRPSLMP